MHADGKSTLVSVSKWNSGKVNWCLMVLLFKTQSVPQCVLWEHLIFLYNLEAFPTESHVTDKGSCAPEIFYRMLLHFRFLSPESRDLLWFHCWTFLYRSLQSWNFKEIFSIDEIIFSAKTYIVIAFLFIKIAQFSGQIFEEKTPALS